MQIRVYFDDGSILENMNVNDSRRFWRYVSKSCNYWRKRGRNVRVIDVEKGINIENYNVYEQVKMQKNSIYGLFVRGF